MVSSRTTLSQQSTQSLLPCQVSKRRCSILSSNFRYDEEKFFWQKTKRRQHLYHDPCNETEKHEVETSTLDGSCADCTYYPATLIQVKCSSNPSNGLNRRGKATCNHIASGDCIDTRAIITVVKVFPNQQGVNHSVILRVGCSCHVLAGF